MKLFGSNTSPYVRKIRIQALEGGYWDQIQYSEMSMAPTDPNMDNVNPLKKIAGTLQESLAKRVRIPILALDFKRLKS